MFFFYEVSVSHFFEKMGQDNKEDFLSITIRR